MVEQSRENRFDPAGFTLASYAAVQIWAQAAESGRATEAKSLITALRTNECDAVPGKTDFYERGDIRRPAYVWRVWKGEKYAPSATQ